jgi:hypothetical protein
MKFLADSRLLSKPLYITTDKHLSASHDKTGDNVQYKQDEKKNA